MEIKYYLKRPNTDSETAIFARISYCGFQLKYYLPEKINPKYWNADTQRAKKTEKFREHPEFNQRLNNIASDIRTAFRKFQNDHQGSIPEPAVFKTLLDESIRKVAKNGAPRSFIQFFQALIEQSRKGVRLHPKTGKPITKNTLKTYVTTLQHLLTYEKSAKRKIDFDNIDLDFYDAYTEYLIKKLSLSTNTVGKHIQIIKLVLNEATERGLNTNLAFKGKRFVTLREKSDSIFLTVKELEALEQLDLAEDKRLERVRDLFLVGAFTGLRFSDYSILNPDEIKDGFIETMQTKTGDKIVIPVHPTVHRIMAKYGGSLPEAISNQKTNEYLKLIGKKVSSLQASVSRRFTKGGMNVLKSYEKWELLTTHTARRSFATNEYLAGVSPLTIMAITGHRTEKSFLRYIKLTASDHAKLLKMNWERRLALS